VFPFVELCELVGTGLELANKEHGQISVRVQLKKAVLHEFDVRHLIWVKSGDDFLILDLLLLLLNSVLVGPNLLLDPVTFIWNEGCQEHLEKDQHVLNHEH